MARAAATPTSLARMPRCALHMAPRTWRGAEGRPGVVPAEGGSFRCQGSRAQVRCMRKVVLPLLPSASPDLAPGRPEDPPGVARDRGPPTSEPLAALASLCPTGLFAGHGSWHGSALSDALAGHPWGHACGHPSPHPAQGFIPPSTSSHSGGPSPLNPPSGPVSLLSSLLREMSSPQRALLGEGLWAACRKTQELAGAPKKETGMRVEPGDPGTPDCPALTWSGRGWRLGPPRVHAI